jgi:hypothetical protein
MPQRKAPCKPAKKPTSKARREALIAEAREARIAPLDYMLDVLNAPKPVRLTGEKPVDYAERLVRWEERRMDAAKAAAPYVHAKPIASVKIESVTDVEEHKPVNVLELAKQVAFLFTMAQVRPEVDITPNKLN